ncbi:MAG: hypothetical protein ACK56I_36325, partial [bacterium]
GSTQCKTLPHEARPPRWKLIPRKRLRRRTFQPRRRIAVLQGDDAFMLQLVQEHEKRRTACPILHSRAPSSALT